MALGLQNELLGVILALPTTLSKFCFNQKMGRWQQDNNKAHIFPLVSKYHFIESIWQFSVKTLVGYLSLIIYLVVHTTIHMPHCLIEEFYAHIQHRKGGKIFLNYEISFSEADEYFISNLLPNEVKNALFSLKITEFIAEKLLPSVLASSNLLAIQLIHFSITMRVYSVICGDQLEMHVTSVFFFVPAYTKVLSLLTLILLGIFIHQLCSDSSLNTQCFVSLNFIFLTFEQNCFIGALSFAHLQLL